MIDDNGKRAEREVGERRGARRGGEEERRGRKERRGEEEEDGGGRRGGATDGAGLGTIKRERSDMHGRRFEEGDRETQSKAGISTTCM